EPEFSKDDLILGIEDWGSYSEEYRPENFSVSWSESEHAAGYWLDFTILEYEIPEEYQLEREDGIYHWPEYDSTKVMELQYQEYPVRFKRSDKSSVRGYLT
ncbi:MAG: hypothetical protein GWO23_21510, partial [Gammaproteobacteria bacterium]|nr:hypothetical protein [Gammaproteobacteria bacterium]NIW47462.1 hypothetical protein [Gammaproteobacteria bacterium]NIX58375.1 hypothetical protein [candidate division Zixibacteria bacterium]